MKSTVLFAKSIQRAAVTTLLGATVLATGCDRAAPPTSAAYAATFAPGTLSTTFGDECAYCHGDAGEGMTAPSLQDVTYAAFTATVRNGKGGMPSFESDIYPDATLKADFTALTGKPAL